MDTGIPRSEFCSVWRWVGTSSGAGRLFFSSVSHDGRHRILNNGMAFGQDRSTPHFDHAGNRERCMFILFRLVDWLSSFPGTWGGSALCVYGHRRFTDSVIDTDSSRERAVPGSGTRLSVTAWIR